VQVASPGLLLGGTNLALTLYLAMQVGRGGGALWQPQRQPPLHRPRRGAGSARRALSPQRERPDARHPTPPPLTTPPSNRRGRQGVVRPLALISAAVATATPLSNHLLIYTAGLGLDGAAASSVVLHTLQVGARAAPDAAGV
jgi:hypothetical protein